MPREKAPRPKTSWRIHNNYFLTSFELMERMHYKAYHGYQYDITTYSIAKDPIGDLCPRRIIAAIPPVLITWRPTLELRILATNHTKIVLEFTAEDPTKPAIGFIGSGNFVNPTVLHDLFVIVERKAALKELYEAYKYLWDIATPFK